MKCRPGEEEQVAFGSGTPVVAADGGNRPLEDWGKLIRDAPSATAILDRFLHHAETIAINGKSYRLRNQKPTASGGADEPFTSPEVNEQYLGKLRERIKRAGLEVALAWLRTRHDVALKDATAAA